MSDNEPSVAKLEKQLRVLQRKLERCEWHRIDLENQHDRDQHLYRRLQSDLEAAHRDAQIEAALERVRSRAMAMRSSDELREMVLVILKEMKALAFPSGRCTIVIFDRESGDSYFWMSGLTGADLPERYHVPYHELPTYKALHDGWRQGTPFFEIELAGEVKREQDRFFHEETEFRSLPEPAKEGMRRMGDIWLSNAAMTHGVVQAVGTERLSEDNAAILQRFAKVIDLTYTRVEDIQQSEAQVREAQIEAALERVRSRAMAMRSSDELGELSYELVKQVQALGVDTWHCAFNIYDEDRESSTEWGANADGFYPIYKTPRTGIFRRYYEIGRSGTDLHVEVIGEDRCADHYDELCTMPGVGEVLLKLRDSGVPFPESQVDHVAYFKYGYLIFISFEPAPEAHDVFRRFARVFEQAYTRFLDLQAAEANAREAQIEAAMERVRSRALAMTSSEELLEVIFKIHHEFAGLGLPCEQFWHTRYTPEVYQKALTGVGGEKLAAVMELPRDFSSQPALAAWERGDEKIGVFMFDADAASTYLHHMITKGHFHQVDPDGITEAMVRERGGFTFVQARTSHGEIGYTLWGETQPSEEAKDVLGRFTGAFDLAYRRFEDLQQAEQQAALDRVRAEVASTLTSDAHVTEATFDPLDAELRTLFGRAGLRLGLASLQADGELNARSGQRLWNSLVIHDALRDATLDWRGTLYEAAMLSAEALAVPDVENGTLVDALREHLLARGVRSLALQPLRTADRTVGLFELSSREAGAVDASTLLKMKRLESTFALAVTQNLEWFETRVESVIQRAYTAIHPSVQWRFREAAIEMLEQGEDTSEPEPVVFQAVYPLYGVADIRSSTHHRNEAVRHDVLGRLGGAGDALASIHEALPLTILDELGLRLRKRIEQYERVWNTGDEAAADRFLTEEVEPVLERLTAGRADLAPILVAYKTRGESASLPRTDAYETSRRAINRTVSDLLLAENAETQRLFPHYFEQTRTDGVEHTMYIGPSITPDRPFDLAYVENLRLRQLIVGCTVAREARRLNDTLPMPLTIAQLVIVQHAPITLRFRADEKRFDMDSPSGVRFELLKKRLDKACVKGTNERITQCDQIAVVYSTEAEEAEYRRYAEYLAAHEHIEPEPKQLDVENLPGVAGLKMLRLKVASSPAS